MTANDIINAMFQECHDRLDTYNLGYDTWCEHCPGCEDCEVGAIC